MSRAFSLQALGTEIIALQHSSKMWDQTATATGMSIGTSLKKLMFVITEVSK